MRVFGYFVQGVMASVFKSTSRKRINMFIAVFSYCSSQFRRIITPRFRRSAQTTSGECHTSIQAWHKYSLIFMSIYTGVRV